MRTDKKAGTFDKLADKKIAYVKKKQYLCSVIERGILHILKISKLAFYILAISI